MSRVRPYKKQSPNVSVAENGFGHYSSLDNDHLVLKHEKKTPLQLRRQWGVLVRVQIFRIKIKNHNRRSSKNLRAPAPRRLLSNTSRQSNSIAFSLYSPEDETKTEPKRNCLQQFCTDNWGKVLQICVVLGLVAVVTVYSIKDKQLERDLQRKYG